MAVKLWIRGEMVRMSCDQLAEVVGLATIAVPHRLEVPVVKIKLCGTDDEWTVTTSAIVGINLFDGLQSISKFFCEGRNERLRISSIGSTQGNHRAHGEGSDISTD
jgi:hypothetical protein